MGDHDQLPQLASTETNVPFPSDPNFWLQTMPPSLCLGSHETANYPHRYTVQPSVWVHPARKEQARTSILSRRETEVGESSRRNRKCKELEPAQAENQGNKDSKSKREGVISHREKSCYQEQTRRAKITEKIKAIKELIPGCDKRGKADILNEAIEYIEAMKRRLQLYQLISMGAIPPHYFPTGINFQMQTYGMPWRPEFPNIPQQVGQEYTGLDLFHLQMVINPLRPLAAAMSNPIVQTMFVPEISFFSTHQRQRDSRSRNMPEILTSFSKN